MLKEFHHVIFHDFLHFLYQDFATPSLNMSEESPSKAILLGNAGGNGNGQQQDIPELAAFQLRRRWESRYMQSRLYKETI